MSDRPVRFEVFGRPMAAIRVGAGWRLFLLGPDGKRRPADVALPDEIEADDLAVYLADIFHECATPRHPEVLRRD